MQLFEGSIRSPFLEEKARETLKNAPKQQARRQIMCNLSKLYPKSCVPCCPLTCFSESSQVAAEASDYTNTKWPAFLTGCRREAGENAVDTARETLKNAPKQQARRQRMRNLAKLYAKSCMPYCPLTCFSESP